MLEAPGDNAVPLSMCAGSWGPGACLQRSPVLSSGQDRLTSGLGVGIMGKGLGCQLHAENRSRPHSALGCLLLKLGCSYPILSCSPGGFCSETLAGPSRGPARHSCILLRDLRFWKVSLLASLPGALSPWAPQFFVPSLELPMSECLG
jgi:hypothetical protein